jgi:hypothetical protein
MHNKARPQRQIWFLYAFPFQVEIDRKAPLNAMAEIAGKHFVARRAMMLRITERAV